MKNRNDDIRKAIRNVGLSQWMIAEHLGISEPTFTRWLRQELSNDKRQKIYQAIEEVKQRVQSSI
jgi:predicted XRE-type DNA-binding protein